MARRHSRKEREQLHAPDLSAPPSQRLSLWRWLRNSFFTGIIVATPVTVTVWLVFSFIGFVDRTVKPLVPRAFNPESYLDFAIPGLGLIVAIVALTMLGALAANILGRSLLQAGEQIVGRLPFVRNIYQTLKQLVETVFSQNQNSFKEVVLMQYPRAGLWALGFITTEAKGEVREHLDSEHIAVFVPSTPNPTSGFILFVPRSDVIKLKMTVEEGAKLIISAGIVTPETVAAVEQKETAPSAPTVEHDPARGEG